MLNRLLSKLPHNAHNQRWGVLAKMVLQWPTGEVYLRRWRLIQTPLFGLYLHKIERGDYDKALHNHPWRVSSKTSFISWIVRGGYTERFVYGPPETGAVEFVEHHPRGVRRFPVGALHQIIDVLPNTWTVLLVGRRVSSWEFMDPRDGSLVPWQEYLASIGRGPMGNRLPVDDVPDA